MRFFFLASSIPYDDNSVQQVVVYSMRSRTGICRLPYPSVVYGSSSIIMPKKPDFRQKINRILNHNRTSNHRSTGTLELNHPVPNSRYSRGKKYFKINNHELNHKQSAVNRYSIIVNKLCNITYDSYVAAIGN